MGEQKRHWILTVHDEHLKKWDIVNQLQNTIEDYFAQCKAVRYACGQTEACPQTGKIHQQIYVEFKDSLRLSQVVKLFPSHAEPRLGTRTDAREYCSKETYNGKSKGKLAGSDWEVGTWRQDVEGRSQTQKQRILQYICVQGLTPADIAKLDPEAYFSHWRNIRALYNAFHNKFDTEAF
jgi:hypothetical protein